MRRSRHWRVRMPISISAMFSQLACLGVWWNSTRRSSLVAARLPSTSSNDFREMDVQVVQHEVNATSLGVGAGEQFVDEGDEVALAPVFGDRDRSLARLGLDRHEQVGRALADVLVVDFGGGVRRHRQRRAAVREQLQALLVDADHRLADAQGFGVQREQVVHAKAVLLAQSTDAPHQPAPGLEVVFFNIRRTVSRLTWLRPGSWRAKRSSSTIVQRRRPSGGAEQASARHSRLGIRVVLRRPAWPLDVEHRQLHATLQVRQSGTPQGGAPDSQHRADLRLWDPAVQAGQDVRTIDLARMMNALAADLLDQPTGPRRSGAIPSGA